MTGKRRRGKNDPQPTVGTGSGGKGRRRAAPDRKGSAKPEPSLADRIAAARSATPPAGPPAAPPTGARAPGRPSTPPRPSAPPTSVVPRRTREQARAGRDRDRRRRGSSWLVVALVVAVVAAGAVYLIHGRNDNTAPPATAAPQTTVLLSVTAADGTALESALLAHDPSTHQGVEVLLPGRVLTEVCGFGDQRLADVLALPGGVALSRQAVSGMLDGITVDGSWVLSTAQLAALVNAVGGVDVNVDVNVEQSTRGGRRVVVIQQGPNQHLDGARAVQFATYQAGGEEEAANLDRLHEVLDAVLAALPQDATGVERVIASLGTGGGSTLGATRLSGFLLGLSADARANAVLPSDLPVVKIDSGGAPSYRVDQQPTSAFVSANLARSLPPSTGQPKKRVFVQNGVGTPGLVGSACAKLTDAGYAFAGSGNAPHFGFARSKVLIFDNSVASAQLGDAVARTLSLPLGDVAVSPAGQNTADVLVILGKDYHP